MKFAETNVAQNAQTLTVEGFENAAGLPTDEPNDALAAPVITVLEDQITPTSISITWDEVEGATSYDLRVDGRAGLASGLTSFTHTGHAYDSTHTYEVRARNAEGVSAWSEVVEVRTAQDPWRNVPTPVSATLDGGPWGGYEEKHAFDHKPESSAGCLLSGTVDGTANGTGRALNIDYGLAYRFERLEYYPSAFGYVKKMKIETSLDGVHWSEVGTYDFTGSNEEVKVLTFDEPIVARYVRMLAVQTDSYWTASEICFYKIDGSKGFAVGSLSGSETCTELDYGNLGQVLGLENRGGEQDMFKTRVSNFYLDLNGNDAYDVYDLVHFMAGYAPSSQDAEVTGELEVTADRSSVSAGDVVTVQLRARGVENANALGALVHYDDEQFEFVPGSITVSDAISGMSNRSVAKTSYTDGVAAGVDTSELQALVDEILAEGLRAEDYTTATWTPFAQALADAERLLADGSTTQETIDQCARELRAAREVLVPTTVPPVEATREALGELISDAEGLDLTGKTEASVAALQDALAHARAVLENDAATASELTEALAELQAALDGLTDQADVPPRDLRRRREARRREHPADRRRLRPGGDGPCPGHARGGRGGRPAPGVPQDARLATAATQRGDGPAQDKAGPTPCGWGGPVLRRPSSPGGTPRRRSLARVAGEGAYRLPSPERSPARSRRSATTLRAVVRTIMTAPPAYQPRAASASAWVAAAMLERRMQSRQRAAKK